MYIKHTQGIYLMYTESIKLTPEIINALLGFEPKTLESKSNMLPLHHKAKKRGLRFLHEPRPFSTHGR